MQFATRAKTIKNKPVVNEIVSDEAKIVRYTREIKMLQTKVIQVIRQGAFIDLLPEVMAKPL